MRPLPFPVAKLVASLDLQPEGEVGVWARYEVILCLHGRQAARARVFLFDVGASELIRALEVDLRADGLVRLEGRLQVGGGLELACCAHLVDDLGAYGCSFAWAAPSPAAASPCLRDEDVKPE